VTCGRLCDDSDIWKGSLVEVGRSIGLDVPKAWKFFGVNYST
jgi:hypothetical protein